MAYCLHVIHTSNIHAYCYMVLISIHPAQACAVLAAISKHDISFRRAAHPGQQPDQTTS